MHPGIIYNAKNTWNNLKCPQWGNSYSTLDELLCRHRNDIYKYYEKHKIPRILFLKNKVACKAIC